MSNVQKPITVARADFISELTTLINNAGLPPFVVEPILKDMLYEVKALAQKQLEQDIEIYRKALENSEQNDTE
jgi:hypothetical protein